MDKRVLVAEDEEPIRKLIKTFLVKWGFEVKEAADGEEAVEQLAGDDFDLLICDVRMPRKDGWEVLRALKSIPGKEVPVILLTGLNHEDDMFKAYDKGATYYITKPFTPSQLQYGIRLIFGQVESYWKAGPGAQGEMLSL